MRVLLDTSVRDLLDLRLRGRLGRYGAGRGQDGEHSQQRG